MERVDAYPVSAAELIHLDDGQDEPQQAADALSIVEEAAVGGELKGGVLTPLALRRPRGGDELLLGSGDGDDDFLEGGHSDRFEELLEGDDLDGDDELECGHLLQRRRASDPSSAALALFAAQLAVVKTVKNSDWTRLLRGWTDAPDPNQRSSVTLPPAGGRGMHLFGKVGSGCAGIAWDRRAIDISDALCWPSGYYAKTEHNMEVDERSGRVLLSNGRADALVSIDDLVAANLSHDASRLLGDDPPHLAYNEISIRLPGPAGIAAVFVRSSRPSHVIFALGVRALLAHSFPELRSLPLLLLTPDDGARAIGPSEELAVIRDHLGAAAPSLFEDRNQRKAVHVVEPRLPLDLSRYPQLSAQEVLTFHAVHGVTRRTLTRLFPTLRAAGDLPGCVSLALAAAAAADNAPSAREVVRAAAPLMLLDAAEGALPSSPPRCETPPAARRDDADAGGGTGGGEIQLRPSTEAMVLLLQQLGSGHTAEALRALGTGSTAAIAALHAAAPATVPSPVSGSTAAIALGGAPSAELLVAIGARVALGEFVAGRTSARLNTACDDLAEWLGRAARPSCTSALFRLRSWHETRALEPESDLHAFMCGKAVHNRQRFHHELLRLQGARDGVEYVTMLYALVSQLRRPCLRLRMLRQVLGLDERFSIAVIHAVACLAVDIVEDIADGGGGGSGATDLESFDEATALEAEARLGPPQNERLRLRRPSASVDPLGEDSRHLRAMVDDRHG